MKKRCITLLIVSFIIGLIHAQEPFIHKSFDSNSVDFSKVRENLSEAEDSRLAFVPTYSKGLKGLCLDLTSDVAVRLPIALGASETLPYDKSFAIELWVKTKKNARQGTPIMSNKKVEDKSKAGWMLGTNDSGAWFFNISDGKSTYNYVPTPDRQSINDGNWHQIAVSVDLDKKEIWFYYDGESVGIYNVDGLATATSELATIIGGSDEYNDWASRREWTAFNGMIDEVKIYNSTLTSSVVKSLYSEFVPNRSESPKVLSPNELKVQVWNIWHGGHRFGEHVGLERVINVLKKENADVIGLIETYGSGEVIADSLGYYFYLISSNLSIMSRYPIEETIKVYKSFNSGGVVLNLGNGNKMAFFDIWLDYLPNMCDLVNDKVNLTDFMKEENNRRGKEIKAILKEIEPYTQNADNVPVFMVGDFNSGSHLDWNDATKDIHNGRIIKWPASIEMESAKYKDSYREINLNPLIDPGFTWSPLISNSSVKSTCIRDRIDYIYYKGKNVQPYWSKSLDHHPPFWPSDHGSVITYFYLNQEK